jgi:hypothetical protein
MGQFGLQFRRKIDFHAIRLTLVFTAVNASRTESFLSRAVVFAEKAPSLCNPEEGPVMYRQTSITRTRCTAVTSTPARWDRLSDGGARNLLGFRVA